MSSSSDASDTSERGSIGEAGGTRVLLFGPRPIPGDVIGGTKVLFDVMERRFAESERFRVTVVNTSRSFTRWRSEQGGPVRVVLNLVGLLRTLGHLLLRARAHDLVLFNGSSRGVLAAGPLVYALCRALRRPLVFRLFGGDFGKHFARRSAASRWLARRTTLRADLFLLETEALCREFAPLARTRRFANTRDGAAAPETPGRTANEGGVRFVFLGQLRLEKGLQLALDAACGLPASCHIDFFGPLLPGVDASLFDGHPRATYRGALAPADVPATLARYDALLFPTLYRTEGIPGAVLEAWQVGVPVIASRWDAAAELIEDGVAGLLVEQGSAPQLAAAMRRFAEDAELRARLRSGARASGERYRSRPWHARLETWLAELVPGAEFAAERATLRAAVTEQEAA